MKKAIWCGVLMTALALTACGVSGNTENLMQFTEATTVSESPEDSLRDTIVEESEELPVISLDGESYQCAVDFMELLAGDRLYIEKSTGEGVSTVTAYKTDGNTQYIALTTKKDGVPVETDFLNDVGLYSVDHKNKTYKLLKAEGKDNLKNGYRYSEVLDYKMKCVGIGELKGIKTSFCRFEATESDDVPVVYDVYYKDGKVIGCSVEEPDIYIEFFVDNIITDIPEGTFSIPEGYKEVKK